MEQDNSGRVLTDQALVFDQAASRLAPSGFDPSRVLPFLSAGARRALLKHTRDGGGLFDSVLGQDDAEELWFCSMQYLLANGERIVTRKLSDGAWSPVYTYRPTPLGYAVRNYLRDSDEHRNGEDAVSG